MECATSDQACEELQGKVENLSWKNGTTQPEGKEVSVNWKSLMKLEAE